jgi:hypothetical protein
MARFVTLGIVIATASLFAWAVPFVRLFDGFQPIITALSIMVAAVFVRLNRGMPTLEWKSADPVERRQLTSRIVSISVEYGWIIAINATLLLGLVTLAVIGKADVTQAWPNWAQRLGAGIIGGWGALCISRMAYVVWRDIDVVRLQKRLIDNSGVREEAGQQAAIADEKVTSIRAAGVRKVDIPPPQGWGNS